MNGHHVTLRLATDVVIAPSVRQRRALARTALRVLGPRGLLAFACADTHVHLLLLADREAAALATRSFMAALRWELELPAPFEPARIRPLQDHWHAWRALHYVIGQGRRHGLRVDPLHDGTILSDLLGLRAVDPGRTAWVRERFPRLRRADLLEHLGLGGLDPLATVTDLADAAAAALALPDLAGRGPVVGLARAAAIHAAGQEPGTNVLADQLGITPRAVRLVRSAPAPEPALVQAVQLQLAARAALAARQAAARPLPPSAAHAVS